MEGHRVLSRAALFGALLAAPCAPGASHDDLVATGRALYRTSMRADGSVLVATTQRDVRLPAASTACVGCHRRSGLGGAEGSVRSPPVTGTVLFQPRQAPPPRPAYDEATLLRAITKGIAADGRELDPLMPRYALTDHDSAALSTYLRSLGAALPDGITATDIHLATVVASDVPEHEREAVVRVVRRFAEMKNSGTRSESRRAAAAERHAYGEQRDRAFRQWQVSVWTLNGPATTWAAQLAALYEQQPPFAVVSGAVGHDWSVVSRFCELRELPCILPITDVPTESADGYYALYFSAGVRLEARVTARHLADSLDRADARVLLVYSDDERGRAASEAFRAAWRDPRLTLRRVPVDAAPNSLDWQEMLALERPDVLILWLGPAQLQALSAIDATAGWLPGRIYTAESLTHWSGVDAPPAFTGRVRHVYPYSLAAPGRRQFPREQAWLDSLGIAPSDLPAAAKALFACHALGEALSGIQGNFSREYLLEELEHMLDGTAMTTLYPRTTLGPGQRFLANGAYVVRLDRSGSTTTFYEPAWVAP